MLSALKRKEGFTLVELLIVIAVIGVLAAVILAVINPLEQLARGRDSGRKSTISQLSNSTQAFFTVNQGAYPLPADLPTPAAVFAGNWATTLTNAEELQTVPTAITGGTACALAASGTQDTQNGYCYITDATGTQAVVYTRLESGTEAAKCSSGNPYFLWSSTQGQTGVVCSAADPTGLSGYTFVN